MYSIKVLSYFSPSLQLSTQSSTPKSDEFLGPVKCFEKKLTRESCDLVFCPPWQRCINGRCTCKPPYLCPAEGMTPVCARDNKQLRSFCQVTTCTVATEQGTNNDNKTKMSVNMTVLYSSRMLVASSTGTVSYISLKSFDDQLPGKCVSVRCQGYENSLAECVIYDKVNINNREVATATCVQPTSFTLSLHHSMTLMIYLIFHNVKLMCVSMSDCRNGAFRCSTGVCLRREAVGDGQIDCLDGEDESKEHTSTDNSDTQTLAVICLNLLSSPKSRHRRMLGGQPTTPTQIQWQVALEMNSQFQCGGAYIGGCWVVTAAHCIGPHPSAFKAKFSLWKRIRVQPSTDLVPVKDIHVHPEYNPITRENDIALVKLEKLPFSEECLMENPAVTPVCVPWTTQLFHPNHTCTISGWGQTSGTTGWVPLVEDCERFYNDSFKPGMICAGNLDGSVDACQGDNGGPLVCEDELGVSYLWGIVSWRQGCVPSRSPGIYTQVAHYFEWIRLHTGWPTVTRFNS
uniref:trypsin n=1 Tax=Lates calcarifer TaxID=8187 RepID=A0A4W6DI10_LATCA